jgi:hypothetical protein
MASLKLNGDASGEITISAPSVAGTNTLTLPATTETLATQNSLGVRNHIINGDFSISQRGTSFTSGANDDDAYTLDRWYILSDGNDAIDVTQETSVVPTNELYAIALDVETANKKFGIAQIIEQKNCVGLIGNTVTLSFKAKVSSTTKLDNVKCAIVSWSGTADTVTSDIVSAWGAEGTDPTLIANATYENTPANLNVTTSYATYSVSAAIDTASTKNVIVFIWSDVTDTTAGDFLYVTDVQLEVGTEATPFEVMPYDMELARCQRYFQTWGGVSNYDVVCTGVCTGGQYTEQVLNYSTTMRAAPTMTYSALGDWSAVSALASPTLAALNIDLTTSKSTRVSTEGTTSPYTAGYAVYLRGNNTTNARFNLSAEL